MRSAKSRKPRQDLVDGIVEKFARFNTRMTDNNKLQAMMPERAIVIDANPVGTAPSFIVETDHGADHQFAGRPMRDEIPDEHAVLPLSALIKQASWIIAARLGGRQAQANLPGEQVADLISLDNPTVAWRRIPAKPIFASPPKRTVKPKRDA
jgi:hypothetical protein